MATINFRTKGKNKVDASIYITFRNGRECSLELKSGIIIPNSDWMKKGELRHLAIFTSRLKVEKKIKDLRGLVSSQLNDSTSYSKEWLQGIIDEFNGKETHSPDTLKSLIKKYINYISHEVGKVRSPNTVKTYYTSHTRIENFEKYMSKKEGRRIEYKVGEVDIAFKGQFIKWSREVEKYQPASYLKTVKQIKTVLKYAQRIGMTVDVSYLNDTESTDPPRRDSKLPPLFLTNEEIEKLMSFKGLDHLENARDWLVISCWTACRVSDLMNLSKSNIVTTITGEKAIKYTQQKTLDKITCPFHPHVGSIISANNGEFPRPISSQKYNDYIKIVCRQVGMTEVILGEKQDGKTNRKIRGMFPKCELVRSHIGRRSFASNHYGLLPTETIMLVTGHDTVRQFLEYVGKEPEEHVAVMHDLYSRSMTNEIQKTSEERRYV